MSLQSWPHAGQAKDAPAPIPDLRIDLTAQTCPMTFVRTRLALDRLRSGQILAVCLRGEEARDSVGRTCAEQGHTVLSQVTDGEGATVLLLRRK